MWFLVLLLALLTASPAVAESEYQGKVVSVLDGDTIEVLHNQHPSHIRLSSIDCPEKGQAYGKRAKQALAGLVFGKEVTTPDTWTRQLINVSSPMCFYRTAPV